MDENEKELTPDEFKKEIEKSDDLGEENKKVVAEEKDEWEFEAKAPTLDDKIEIGNDFELDVEEEKPLPKKSPSKSAQPEQIVINKKPIKIVLYSLLTILIVAVLVFLGVRYYTVPNSDEKMNPGNVALTVGDEDVSIGMYNYYYSCIVNNYVTYAGYGYYDIDTTKDYATQYTTDADGNDISWLQKFQDDTVDQIQYITAYYNDAVKNGVTLTDEQKDTINTQMTSLESTASSSEVSVNEYISSSYGDYCGEATLKKMLEQCYLAQNYYYQADIENTSTDDEVKKYFEDNQDNYKDCSFAYIETTYDTTSEDTQKASVEKAKEYCSQITDVDSMKKLIPTACADLINQYISSGYFEDADSAAEILGDSIETSCTASEAKENFSEELSEWLFSDDTKVGSTTYVVDEDYGYVYIFLKTSEPKLKEDEVYSVRQILVTPGDDDSSDSSTDSTSTDTSSAKTYTDDQWSAAYDKAKSILSEYQSGDLTEYSFAELAEKDSDDTESTSSGSSGLYGGAYLGISLKQMVSEFEGWATDDSRKYGDVDIVKSAYGYHILYFIDDGPNYLYLAKKDLKQEKEDKYVDSYTVKKHKNSLSKTKKAEPTSASTQSQSSSTASGATSGTSEATTVAGTETTTANSAQ